jgi:hypothetical protein
MDFYCTMGSFPVSPPPPPINDGPMTQEELRLFFRLLVKEIVTMDAALQKLAADIAAQNTAIDRLIAEKTASNDADVATLTTALEANTAKITAALASPTP